jgi:hypothetical protein
MTCTGDLEMALFSTDTPRIAPLSPATRERFLNLLSGLHRILHRPAMQSPEDTLAAATRREEARRAVDRLLL